MAHNARRIKKKRGSRSCGHGNTQKHRGAGSRGGRGMGGGKKQKWSYVSKYMPNYFGYSGFKRPEKVLREVKTINLGDIDRNLGRMVEEKKAKIEDKKYVLDLKSMGYDKLLGSGKVSKPLLITVEACSQLAAKKVEEAGGKVQIPE